MYPDCKTTLKTLLGDQTFRSRMVLCKKWHNLPRSLPLRVSIGDAKNRMLDPRRSPNALRDSSFIYEGGWGPGAERNEVQHS